MRVLAITNMYPTAAFPGRGVFVHEQIQGLRAIGLAVRVLFIDRWHEGPWAYYRVGPKLAEALAEFGPDLIHVMYGGVMADQVVRRAHGRPVVVTFHGSDLLGEPLSGGLRRLSAAYGVHCSRRAARRAQGVVVVAQHLVRALRRAVHPAKLRVIPCGIDLGRFQPLDSTGCKRQLGWDPSSFHVLFASSNGDPVKRPWLAEAAVASLNRSSPTAVLHHLTGIPNERVPIWLSASDVLLLTSQHEGSPTVVKEALACGLPVVSVDVGDVAERLTGITGCFLAAAEPEDLSRKLQCVQQRRPRLECRARLAELSTTQIAQRLRRHYEQVTAGSSGPIAGGDATADYPSPERLRQPVA